MGQWTNYVDSTTPAGTWTILCYPGSGQIREVALSDVMTQLIGANYARTCNVDAVLSTTLQSIEVAGVATPIKVATNKVLVGNEGDFVGFFGVGPVEMPVLPIGANLADVIAALVELGLVAQAV